MPDYYEIARQRMADSSSDGPVDYFELAKKRKDQLDNSDSGIVLDLPGSKQQKRFPAGVNNDQEYSAQLSNFLISGAAGLKFTTEGTANFLQEKLGKGNVFVQGDNIYVLPEEEQKKPLKEQRPIIFNKEGLSKGDIATTGPALLAGIGTGGAAAAAAGGLTGAGALTSLAVGGAAESAIRQVASAALPGEDNATPFQQVSDVVLSAGLELAAPFVGKAIVKVAPKVIGAIKKAASTLASPIDTIVGKLAGRGAKESIQEGVELGAQTGIDFTQASLSQTQGAIKAQAYAANQLPGGSLRNAINKERQQLKEFSDKVISDLQPLKESGSDTVKSALTGFENGLSEISGAVSNIDKVASPKARQAVASSAMGKYVSGLEKLAEARSKAASEGFSGAIAAAGNRKVIDLTNTINTIDEIILTHSTDVPTQSSEAVVNGLSKIKDKLLGEAERLAIKNKQSTKNLIPKTSIPSLKNALSEWGKKSVSPGDVIEGLKDPSKARFISSKVFGSLLDDLSEAVESGKPGANKLKVARDTYRELSKPINELLDNPASKFVDEPEKLIQALSKKNATAEQVGILKALDKHFPDDAAQVREAVVSGIFSKVKRLGADGEYFDPDVLLKTISDNEVILNNIGTQASKEHISTIKMLASRLKANPLKKYLGDEESLISAIMGKGKAKDTRIIMKYLGETNPDAAGDLGAKIVERIVDSASPPPGAGVNEVLNLSAVVRGIESNRSIIDATLAANKESRAAVDALLKASRRIAASGSASVSSTQPFQVANDMIKYLAGGAVVAGATAGGVVGGAVTAIAPFITSRQIARSMANPRAARAYAKILEAASKPPSYWKNPEIAGPLRQALGDIIIWNEKEKIRKSRSTNGQQVNQ